jgi:hypothetical protein
MAAGSRLNSDRNKKRAILGEGVRMKSADFLADGERLASL